MPPVRIALALAAVLALPSPALAAKYTADDHGTKVTLDARKLTVHFTKSANPTLMSHVQGKTMTMGCADGDMKVLGSRLVKWGKKQKRRVLVFRTDISEAAHFCFVARPDQVADGVLTGAVVMGFLRQPTPNV